MNSLNQNLAEFEKFQNETLKVLRKDAAAGMTAKEMRKKYMALLQAKVLTSAFTTDDVSKAQAVFKDIADREEGKPTEKQEVTHRLEKLSANELDALLKSEEEDLKRMEAQFSKEH